MASNTDVVKKNYTITCLLLLFLLPIQFSLESEPTRIIPTLWFNPHFLDYLRLCACGFKNDEGDHWKCQGTCRCQENVA